MEEYYYQCVTKGTTFIENYITLLKDNYPSLDVCAIEYSTDKLFIKSAEKLEDKYVNSAYYDYLVHSDNPGIRKVKKEDAELDLSNNNYNFHIAKENFLIYITQLKKDNPDANITGIWDDDNNVGKVVSSIDYYKLNHPGYKVIIDIEGYLGEDRDKNNLQKLIYKYYDNEQRFEKYPALYIDKKLYNKEKEIEVLDKDVVEIESIKKPVSSSEEETSRIAIAAAKVLLRFRNKDKEEGDIKNARTR